MRELLLKYGAAESTFEKDRWELRQRADKCERILGGAGGATPPNQGMHNTPMDEIPLGIRLQNERDIIDSKAFSPVAATLELM